MPKVINYIFVLILLLIFLYAFSSSYTSHNIDSLAYVIAMGVDSTDSQKIQVTFQFTETSSFSSQGSSGEASTFTNTVEATSINSAINLINAYVGKEVNLAHCKVIVFSETIAKNGLSEHVYTLMNEPQLRPTSNIVISRCDAKYYLENSQSSYENIITKYYDIFPKSADYTGYISNVTIGEFFNQIRAKTSSPTAILGGVNTGTSESASALDSDYNILANDSTIVGERGTENIGLAVFKGGSLVGELTALESLCHSIITNEVNSFLISIPNPKNADTHLDFSITKHGHTKVQVDVSNGSPHITINIELMARILSIDENNDYLDESYLNTVTDSVNAYLKSRISEYLYKTSTKFKSCIDGFDKHAVKNFLTNNDWEAYDWASAYPHAFFDVNVDTKVSSSLLLTES